MQILFVHQNFPGQYRYIARYFAAQQGWQAYAIGEKPNVTRQIASLPKKGIQLLGYELPAEDGPRAMGLASEFESQLIRAQAVAGVALRQQKKGLDPDIICSHPGWGDSIYLKEVFPRAKFLSYFEFYHQPDGPLVNFDPEFPTPIGGRMAFRSKNAMNLLSLEMADAGVCPTQWQWNTFPEVFRDKIQVIHDGIDTELVAPRPDIRITINHPDTGPLTLSRDDEIITYSVRNLEPNRGFHVFMRALPKLQKRRPGALTIIVGGNEISYGKAHPSGKNWKDVLLDEVGDELDLTRVLFVGKVPYETLLNLFSITSLHIYLTSPFVLSWSMLEAMACQAPVLASATAPVMEVIEDGVNGFLFDYHNGDELVEKAAVLLGQSGMRRQAGVQARQTIIDSYDLKTLCLPAHIRLIESLLGL